MRISGVVSLAALAAAFLVPAAPALAEDLVFILDNQSSAAIVEFYTSPVDVGDWESDLLEGGRIGAGSIAEITIADDRAQCAYDFRIVFEDGAVLEDGNIDLCESDEYTVTD